jgi:hypothetical protein
VQRIPSSFENAKSGQLSVLSCCMPLLGRDRNFGHDERDRRIIFQPEFVVSESRGFVGAICSFEEQPTRGSAAGGHKGHIAS